MKWAGAAVQGDLGKPFRGIRSVNDIVVEKLPNTVKLAVTAFAIELVIGLFAGSSRRSRYSFWDVLVTVTTTLAIGFRSSSWD